jgi:hypothetical protein
MKEITVFRLPLRIFTALLVLSLTLTGCALKGNARHVTVVGNVAVAESLFAIQATADTLRETNQITVEQRQTIAKALLPALETGQQLAKLTAAWPEGKPAPAELQVLVGQLKGLVDQVLGAFPDTPAKAALGVKIAIAQNAAMALILVFVQ